MEPTQPDPLYERPVDPVRYEYRESGQAERPAQYPRSAAPDPRDPYRNYERNAWYTYRISQIIYTVLGILEVLLLLRFALKLLAADPGAAFTAFIYGVTNPFVAPFQGVFPNAHGGGSVLELATLLAMLVYALLAWAIERIVNVARQPRPPVAQ